MFRLLGTFHLSSKNFWLSGEILLVLSQGWMFEKRVMSTPWPIYRMLFSAGSWCEWGVMRGGMMPMTLFVVYVSWVFWEESWPSSYIKDCVLHVLSESSFSAWIKKKKTKNRKENVSYVCEYFKISLVLREKFVINI